MKNCEDLHLKNSVSLQMNRLSRKNLATLWSCQYRQSSFWTSDQVRKTFLDFFKENQHEIGKEGRNVKRLIIQNQIDSYTFIGNFF